ncbi:hypothetical protein Mcup_1031 [Metallosphaera cuprina Ar-4]|uniref:Uncharacterized protein n=1 Tax=Metallosphaera cuprina (strain Ar-4) TaxID=1006006 RepID=F4G2T8_METCR|nr:hypothetical protein Mcup_1031 [Metallosphaera cuprina Ar-4]
MIPQFGLSTYNSNDINKLTSHVFTCPDGENLQSWMIKAND